MTREFQWPADRPSRAFYAASVGSFLQQDPTAIIGALSERHVAFHASAEAEQVKAWRREIEILAAAFEQIGPRCYDWSLLLEYPLLRLGKRLDAVVLSPGVVHVVEFKIGAKRFTGADRLQTEMYAQALRDFHEVAQRGRIVPILCAEGASATSGALRVFDQVADLIEVGASGLADALLLGVIPAEGVAETGSWGEFDHSAYRPTPNIVEAARALYSGHEIAEIGRGDAADEELQRAAVTLNEIVDQARIDRTKTVCFVTGAPGAGKTLLGLNLALSATAGEGASALLSGNRPLVHVLTEALAEDASRRNRTRKADEKHRASAAIQNLLGFLKEHTDGAAPPENVIIFDEAQRAWDADVGQKLMGRPQSEPELFLSILDRLDWACLVCLVGPGQEINRGEGGLALWGEALAKAASNGSPWNVIAAPQAIAGGRDVSGSGLQQEGAPFIKTRAERRIHLSNSIRAYRNELHGKWVATLLEDDIAASRALALEMTAPPAFVTRDLSVAKSWLQNYRRGGRTVGLLASSGAIRLVADGVPPAPRSNELDQIGHWFLKAPPDFRSSGSLETPMSEFGCQGLEIDYAGVCWGGDLIRGEAGWLPRRMQSPHWRVIGDEAQKRFRINGYRVLLTRARAGLVIYVPEGNAEDATRAPQEFDAVADVLLASGCEQLW